MSTINFKNAQGKNFGITNSALQFIGATTSNTTTVNTPKTLPGDIIIIFAYRGGNVGIPTLPSTFLSVLTKAGTTNSCIVGYRIATTTGDSSGTWTNATNLICHVYRPPLNATLGIGVSASSASITDTVNYPALTLVDQTGASLVIGFAGVTDLTQTIGSVPTGMVARASVAGASYAAASFDTGSGVASWSSTNVVDTGTAGHSVSCTIELISLLKVVSSSNLDTLYHFVGMAELWGSRGITCQNLIIPWPNPSGANNCPFLCITYPNGTTLTFSDSLGDTWSTTPYCYANGGSGNYDSSIYILPNCQAGQRLLTVTFSTAPSQVQYSVGELYGIATTSPGNGTSNNAFITGPHLSCGTFTPGNNNSNNGNVLLTYYAKASGTSATSPQYIFQSNNFTLIHSDVVDQTQNPGPHSEGIFHQAISTAINPSATAINDTDKWNCLAIALALSPGAGTAPQTGVRLNKMGSMIGNQLPATATIAIQAPGNGNIRLIDNADPNITFATVNVWDNEGKIYKPDGQHGGFFYTTNTQRNDNLIIYMNNYGGDPITTFVWYDISKAPDFPNVDAELGNQATPMTFTLSPTPNPVSGPGITIASIGMGTGPALSVTSPAGAIWDVPNYTGKTDYDTMNSADFQAHYYFTSGGSQTWSGTCAVDNSDSGGFISFY